LNEFRKHLHGQKLQRTAQMRFVAVLEGVDQVAAGAFVDKGCPCRIKMRGLRAALAADMISSGTDEGNQQIVHFGEIIGDISSRQPGQI
jgi:hypothetical protein